MNAKRPNQQQMLLFTRAEAGEARPLSRQEVEASTTPSAHELPAAAAAMPLMEAICSSRNLSEAIRRVISNKGAPGVDGMTVRELEVHWRQHGSEIVSQLQDGTYRPAPVRRVEIEKPDGGTRKLGVPTVVDRVIQQAILQVLQPIWEPTFSPHSYGFRPGRSAHQAVSQAKAYIASGRGWVVDIDLEKFFDRVNHDKLMRRLHDRVDDHRVVRVIRAYLNAGVMENGLVQPSEEGTPQGGPLSPLLSNIVLDELDKELERRGHAFVRYADDCNIYVRSERAGQRVMEGVSDFLTHKLKLKVNQSKSAVDKPRRRKFLGFTFTERKATVLISEKAVSRFKDRVRALARRGPTGARVIADLNTYLRGWAGYYGHCEAYWILRDLDSWIRRRLRALSWRSWRTPRQRFRQLTRRGVDWREALRTVWRKPKPWAASKTLALNMALPDQLWHNRLGLLSLHDAWRRTHAQS